MGRATLRGALSPSLRPRQKRGFEDHTESYQQGWNQARGGAGAQRSAPATRLRGTSWQAGRQGAGSALPPMRPVILAAKPSLAPPGELRVNPRAECRQQFVAIAGVAGSGAGWIPSKARARTKGARSRSPPHVASRFLSPASLRGSGSLIRSPSRRWRLVTRETRRAACGCLGNLARAKERGARLQAQGAGLWACAARPERRLESLRDTCRQRRGDETARLGLCFSFSFN